MQAALINQAWQMINNHFRGLLEGGTLKGTVFQSNKRYHVNMNKGTALEIKLKQTVLQNKKVPT